MANYTIDRHSAGVYLLCFGLFFLFFGRFFLQRRFGLIGRIEIFRFGTDGQIEFLTRQTRIQVEYLRGSGLEMRGGVVRRSDEDIVFGTVTGRNVHIRYPEKLLIDLSEQVECGFQSVCLTCMYHRE